MSTCTDCIAVVSVLYLVIAKLSYMDQQDARLDHVKDLLDNYTQEYPDAMPKAPAAMGEVESIARGVKMLGEELKATTVSRDFFNNIYNSVGEMLIVFSADGVVTHVNSSACDTMGCTTDNLLARSVSELFMMEGSGFFETVKSGLETGDGSFSFETICITAAGNEIPIECHCSMLIGSDKKKQDYLVIVEDITHRKEAENTEIRTIVDTQEEERQRFAKDLHDSIGQQLMGIRQILSAASTNELTDEQFKDVANKSLESIDRMKVELKNVCFSLMPQTLREEGLTHAISELCAELEMQKVVKVERVIPDDFTRLERSLETAIFRIIQELVNNAIRHGKATKLTIQLDTSDQKVMLQLSYNGIGFEPDELEENAGMGLRNVRSRVKSYQGHIDIESAPDKGTKYNRSIPLIENLQ